MKSKHLTLRERSVYRGLEDVVGCKWSAAVVGALHRGIVRPGQLERYIPGISTKILNERLRKLLVYGLATRADHSKVSLHVEYRLTPTGAKLAGVIEQLHALQEEHAAALAADDQAAARQCGHRARMPRPQARKVGHGRVRAPDGAGTRLPPGRVAR
jgi:DNA-binding HxlR family transcriptional regulator